MKKGIAIVLTFALIFTFSGCSDNESVEFNVYHSNTENHKWEHLKTFSCSPEKKHFVDVRVEGTKNHITITSEENRVEKTENTESYYTEDIDTYDFMVDGFDGQIHSFQTFEVKDIHEEQFYRLYPISNDYGIIFQDLKLDRPCLLYTSRICGRAGAYAGRRKNHRSCFAKRSGNERFGTATKKYKSEINKNSHTKKVHNSVSFFCAFFSIFHKNEKGCDFFV